MGALCPFTASLWYSQMATHLLTPSLLTVSHTYSLPSRNSWTSTPSFCTPSPFSLPKMSSQCALTSSSLRHSFTSSLPALSTGFTMTLKGTGFHSLSHSLTTGSYAVALHCMTALVFSPGLAGSTYARNFSHMSYLFLLASVPSLPLPLRLSFSASLSASCTPVSAPAMHATTSRFCSCATLSTSPAVYIACMSSENPSFWPMMASKCSSRPFGTRLTTFSSSERDAEYTQTTA
mmetsp:Transcript_13308/g.26436  ORF Transcript_13308/g.26436 Transcript_13308/m.26436 type:complete len:234 (+) Transcript_13308:647-1348(+)